MPKISKVEEYVLLDVAQRMLLDGQTRRTYNYLGRRLFDKMRDILQLFADGYADFLTEEQKQFFLKVVVEFITKHIDRSVRITLGNRPSVDDTNKSYISPSSSSA